MQLSRRVQHRRTAGCLSRNPDKRVETTYTHKKRTGGTGQFARVKIVLEPNIPGAGSPFASKIVGGAMPEADIRDVKNGINSVMSAGVLAGFLVVDVKATLIDGAFHDVDASVPAFEIASRAAFREAWKLGGSVLLEPIMTVEVTTPEDERAFVRRDLQSRRGILHGEDAWRPRDDLRDGAARQHDRLRRRTRVHAARPRGGLVSLRALPGR